MIINEDITNMKNHCKSTITVVALACALHVTLSPLNSYDSGEQTKVIC